MFNLGIIKFSIEINKEGELRFGLDILEDFFKEAFPPKVRYDHEDIEEYKKDQDRILREKEKWIRENIEVGTYSFVFDISDENFKLEKE